MRIGTKLVSVAAASLLLTSLAILILTSARLSQFSSSAQGSLRELTGNVFQAAVSGARNLVSSTDEALRSQVEKNMEVGMFLISSAGSLSLLSEEQSVPRLNSRGESDGTISLRVPAFGEAKLTATQDASVSVPVVDALSGLVGGAAAVFQKANADGDFIAVATSIKGPDSKRGTGLVLPAKLSDGSVNPVTGKLLNNERFVGVINLRGQAYVAAVQPLIDIEGDSSAALFVGVLQSQFESLRNTLAQTRIGGRGNTFVLQGRGEGSGTYLLAPVPADEGRKVLDVKDSGGRAYISEMINLAVSATGGQVVDYSYSGDQQRQVRVALAYYAPWDWVIGAQAYEDEFEEGVRMMRSLTSRTIWQLIGISLLAAVLASVGFWWFSQGISRGVQRMTEVAQALAVGDVRKAEDLLNNKS